MLIVGNVQSTGSLKKLKKKLKNPNPVTRPDHFLGICHYIFIYFLFLFFPYNLCFKSSEGVQERAWSTACCHLGRPDVAQQSPEEGKVWLVRVNRQLVTWTMGK